MPTNNNDFDIIVKAILDDNSLKDIENKITKVQRDVVKEAVKVTAKDVGVDKLGKSFDATYIFNQEKQLISTTRDYASALKRQQEESKKATTEAEKLALAQKKISQQTSTISNKFDSFNNKLLSAKNTGKITEEQFDVLSSSLSKIKTNFDKSDKSVENFGDISFKTQDDLSKLNNKLNQYTAESKEATTNTNTLGNAIQKFTQWYLVAGVVTSLIRKIKDTVTQVKLLDSALVELNKVTDLSKNQLDNYVKSAFNMASQLKTTGVAVINASTEFARAGYTAKEALDLSEIAIKLTNVAEGITNTSEASNILISVLKGSGQQFENFNQQLAMANKLLDQLNNISNNNAISFDSLASMIQSVEATMSTLQNTTTETLSLLTGAYEVLQDERVAKGISVIGLRIAGLNEDLEEEEGLASKVGKALRDYAGIDVFDEQTKQLRSTYDILEELASKWDGLTKNTKAYLTTTLAGKNRADVLNALMTNWQGVQNAMEDATNSLGSANKEMEAYFDSIEAHVESFNNTWQKLSTDFMKSDFIKFIVDGATWILELVDSLGGIRGILIEIISLIAIIKLNSIISLVNSLGVAIKQSWQSFNLLALSIRDVTGQTQFMVSSLKTAQLALGGLLAIITVSVFAINKFKQAEEERLQAIENSYKNAITNYEQEISILEELENRYLELYNKTNKTESQKEQLIELTKELAKAYGLEEDALAKLNGETATTQEVYEESIKAKIEELETAKQGMYSAYDIAKKQLNDIQKITLDTTFVSKQTIDDIFNQFDNIEIRYLDGKEFIEFKGDLQETLDFYKKVRSDFIEENKGKELDKYQEEYLSNLNEKIDELTTQFEDSQTKVNEYLEKNKLIEFYKKLGDEIANLQVKINDFNNTSLQEQADNYKEIQNQIEELIKQAPEYEEQIKKIFNAFYEQVDVLKNTDFLLEKMEDELDSLKKLKEARDEELEQQEKLLKVEEARAKLAEAMNKKVRVYRAGQGFVYESDYSEVQNAQEDLAKALRDAELDDLSQAIKNLTKAIEVYNKAQSEQSISGQNSLREYFMSSENQKKFMNMNYEEKISTLQKYAPNVDWANFLNPSVENVDFSGWLASINNTTGNEPIDTQPFDDKIANAMSSILYYLSGGFLNDYVPQTPMKYLPTSTSTNQNNTQNFGNIVLPNVNNVSGFINELKQIAMIK